MPRPPPTRPRSSSAKLHADRTEMVRLKELGWSNTDIAKHLDLSLSSITQGLQKVGWRGVRKVCVLEECGKEFWTRDTRHSFCCRLHTKRHHARVGAGVVGLFKDEVECALPECRVKFKRRGTSVVYCCKRHGDLHNRRVEHRGFYDRILHISRLACMVCGERYVLDEHHIEFKGAKSNKQSKTVWLCPTHHMAIHRGFARFEGEKYVHIVEDIREGLRRKHPQLGTGDSWAAK